MESLNREKVEQYLGSLTSEYKNKAGMFLCLSGSAEILVNNQLFHVERGMLYIIGPLVTLHKVSQSDDFDGVHIIDDLAVFYAVIHAIVDTLLHIKLHNDPCIRLSEEEINFILYRKQQIEERREAMQKEETKDGKMLFHQMIHLLEQEAMLEVLHIFLSRSKPEDALSVKSNEQAVYCFIYSLHTNFKEQRSVSFYANEAQLSPGHFTSVVKQCTGLTPSEWIVAITITHARLQLEQSKKSIKEIASELNFPEQFTFRKYFKQYVGVPPKEYRLQMLKEKNKEADLPEESLVPA